MRKKLFTFLLALVTSVGLSYAAPDASGSCGDNVTYSFNGTTGEMVISGTGPMTVYTSGSSLLPWKDYKDAITSVVVEDGVTSVSQYSFGLCTNLTTVVIGNDVETIGQFAFNDCGTSFTSLTLGSSLKSVGMAAFLNAKGITTLTLPDGFETVGDYAFCRLEALQTLNIPSSVTSIGTSAFYRCYPLATINCAAVTPPSLGDDAFGDIANKSNIPLNVPNGSVAAYEAAAQWTDFDIQGYDPAPAPANVCGDGLTWELNGGVLTISYDGVGTGEMTDFDYENESPVIVAPWKENKSAITTVVIGDGVKSIGNYAFNDLGENFTAVTIANSVERIGLSAFMNAKWITEITLPSSLKTIDRECFAANFGFTSITIPSGVTSIGYHAFSYCKALTSLTCEATTPPTLASGVFYKIRSTTSSISSIPLYVPSGSVAAYEAAAQWNAFDIHGYDPAPASNPHGECGAQGDNLLWELDPSTGVLTITGSGAMYDWTSDTDRPWYSLRAQITSVVLPSGITTLGKYAFRGTDIVSINMTENYPAGLTTINQEAFFSTQLTSITIPESVVTIGMDAFRESKTITDVYCYADPNNLTWNDYWCDDFKNADHATVCHVKACALSTYEAKWGGTPYNVYNSTGVNVTFVGDLPGDCPAPTPTNEQVPTNADPENPTYHYSTFFHSTQNYKLSNDGTQAFIADLSNNELVLTEIAHGEQVIPANTAVILRKTGSADPVVLIPTEENGAIINPDDNSLRGVDEETTLVSLSINPLQCYVLSGKSHDETESGVGFYLIYGNSLRAHKAYVIFAGGSNNAPKKMRFVYGQATGIENTSAKVGESEKILENGQLFIIKNGVKYNAMGQIVK